MSLLWNWGANTCFLLLTRELVTCGRRAEWAAEHNFIKPSAKFPESCQSSLNCKISSWSFLYVNTWTDINVESEEFVCWSLLWFNPSRSINTPQLLAHFPLSGMVRRTGKVKAWELVDWNKDSLISKEKLHSQSKTRNSSSTTHQQAGVQPFPAKQGSIMPNSCLGGQMPWLQMPPSLPLPQLYSWALCHLYSVGYPSGQLGSAVLAVSSRSSLCTPSLLTVRAAGGAENFQALCKRCSATTKTSVCYQYWSHHKSKTQHPVKLHEEN